MRPPQLWTMRASIWYHSLWKKLAEGRTTLTIAHRLTTIQGADRILVLSGNEIVEEGNHKELLEKKGMYYQLYMTANRLNQGLN